LFYYLSYRLSLNFYCSKPVLNMSIIAKVFIYANSFTVFVIMYVNITE
jgi:hypothetical protein